MLEPGSLSSSERKRMCRARYRFALESRISVRIAEQKAFASLSSASHNASVLLLHADAPLTLLVCRVFCGSLPPYMRDRSSSSDVECVLDLSPVYAGFNNLGIARRPENQEPSTVGFDTTIALESLPQLCCPRSASTTVNPAPRSARRKRGEPGVRTGC